MYQARDATRSIAYGLGLAAGSRVLTPYGFQPVESLRRGDLVVDYFGCHKRICDRVASVPGNPDADQARFIRFSASSMGPNSPERDVAVPASAHVLVRGIALEMNLWTDAALAAADDLVNGGDITIAELLPRSCVQILFESHVFLIVDGLAVESGVVPESQCPRHSNIYAQGKPLTDLPKVARCGCGRLPVLTWAEIRMIWPGPIRKISARSFHHADIWKGDRD